MVSPRVCGGEPFISWLSPLSGLMVPTRVGRRHQSDCLDPVMLLDKTVSYVSAENLPHFREPCAGL